MAVVATCHVCRAKVLESDVRCAACGVVVAAGASRIGTVLLDRYEVVDLLGQGGMSLVYRGRHRETGQAVALKILPPELAAQDAIKSRFVEEARALARLDHPSIVHLLDFGEDTDCFVLAMEYVAGLTWERAIIDRGRLDWRTTARIAIDVARALEYAHSRGVIHRDMKPSNVMVRADGCAKVMDFGIAKMTTSSRLTATGQTMGTVRYMSPEQVRAGPLDHRTDLYSLAVTIYESLTGDTPFDGDSQFEIMTAHLNLPPPPLGERAPDCPVALESLVSRAMAKRVADRPADAAAMREELEAILAGQVVAVRRPAAVPRPSRPAWIGLAALALAAGVATAAWQERRGGGDTAAREERGGGGGAAAREERRGGGATAAWQERRGGGAAAREERRGGGAAAREERRAGDTDPGPAPFLLPGLAFAVDQRFADNVCRGAAHREACAAALAAFAAEVAAAPKVQEARTK